MEHLEKDIKDIEEKRIDFYQACLEEFSHLDYSDPYLEEIKEDVKRLQSKSEQE